MRICIDPGHGGRDPGAIGPTGLHESDVVLMVSYIITARLAVAGVKVALTRSDDYFNELWERRDMARDFGADIFISVHCNAAADKKTGQTDPRAHGVETFHWPGNESGGELAETLQGCLIKATGLRNRGVKAGRFTVLNNPQIAGALVEIGFITNPEEEGLMRRLPWLRAVGAELAEGLLDFAVQRR